MSKVGSRFTDSPNSGYLYLFLINNFTVTLALYGLLLFYFATRDQLRPFKPLLKFATMKAIIFFSFWQDVLFSILEWSHVVSGSQGYPAGLLAAGCKNVLVCIELVITAIALRYAFPYSIYVLHHPPRLVLDLPLGGQDWSGFAGTNPLGQDVVFKESAVNVNNKLRTLRADLLIGTSAFAERSPPTNQTQPEPLPWDIAESRLRIDDPEPHTWDGHNSVTLPTISASIKATIDPRDIFVDAIHNFHPNYRHYTQVLTGLKAKSGIVAGEGLLTGISKSLTIACGHEWGSIFSRG
ncbi:transmembrane protein 184A [Clonorchis sinensis]|uniref:Transmembrane protein 184A n=1 Tax=Clonorchis sinensis TaxID=79923 RepID=G7Y8K2_CLOSI|nr:transmembrane protein 184A [Clonorchis sinensis]